MKRLALALLLIVAGDAQDSPAPPQFHFEETAWANRYTYGVRETVIKGTLVNDSGEPLMSLMLEIGLFDKKGTRLGSAIEGVDIVPPGGRWSFVAVPLQLPSSVTYARPTTTSLTFSGNRWNLAADKAPFIYTAAEARKIAKTSQKMKKKQERDDKYRLDRAIRSAQEAK